MGIKKNILQAMAATRPELWIPIRHASILMYHGVLSAERPVRNWCHLPVPTFEAQMEFLRRQYHPISMDELVVCLREGAPLPPRAVVVTFDDGLRNNAEVAAPILRRLKIPATFYITTDFIGSGRLLWADRLMLFQRLVLQNDPALWAEVRGTLKKEFGIDVEDDPAKLVEVMKRTEVKAKRRAMDWLIGRLGEPDTRPEAVPYLPMTGDQLRGLDADPLFTIGAHSRNHEIISQCDAAEARRQILEGKAELEAMLGHGVDHFAFPNGRLCDIGEQGRRIVAEAGFLSTCTSVYGNVSPCHDPYDLPRLGVGNESNAGALVRLGLSGVYPALRALGGRFWNGCADSSGDV